MKMILRDLNSLLAGLEPFVAEYLEETSFRPFSELRIETAAQTVVVLLVSHVAERFIEINQRTIRVFQTSPITFSPPSAKQFHDPRRLIHSIPGEARIFRRCH